MFGNEWVIDGSCQPGIAGPSCRVHTEKIAEKYNGRSQGKGGEN